MQNTDISELAKQGVFFLGSGQNFAQEVQSDKYFRLELSNNGSSAEDQLIALCPGRYASAGELSSVLGVTVAAIIGDGTILNTLNKEITCTGEPTTVVSWLRYFLRHASRFTGITLESTNTAQFSQIIKVYEEEPYVALNTILSVNPNTYKSNSQFNDKLINIPLDHFQLDDSHIVVFVLKANTTLTITLSPGAYQDANQMLQNEARREFTDKGLKRIFTKQ